MEEEQQRYCSEGDVILLPDGKTSQDSKGRSDSQLSATSDEDLTHDVLARLKGSKSLTHTMVVDHNREVAHYQNTKKQSNNLIVQGGQKYHIQQPDRSNTNKPVRGGVAN